MIAYIICNNDSVVHSIVGTESIDGDHYAQIKCKELQDKYEKEHPGGYPFFHIHRITAEFPELKLAIERQKEQIQQDLLCLFDGVDGQKMLDQMCQIVVDRLNILLY